MKIKLFFVLILLLAIGTRYERLSKEKSLRSNRLIALLKVTTYLGGCKKFINKSEKIYSYHSYLDFVALSELLMLGNVFGNINLSVITLDTIKMYI